MYKYISIFSLCLIGLLLSSCTGEENTGLETGVVGKAQLSLKLPSTQRLGAASQSEDKETLITNLSLFVFDSNTGDKELFVRLDIPYTDSSTDIDMSRWVNDQVITIINATLLSNLSRERNIHVIANIDRGELNSINTESELQAVITKNDTEQTNTNNETYFLMHGVVRKHSFIASSVASISLVRNVAKIKLNVNTKDFSFGSYKVVLAPLDRDLSMRVHNVASSSFVVSRGVSPQQSTYTAYATKKFKAESRVGSSAKSSVYTYVSENLRATYDADKNATYFVLQIPYQIEGSAEVKDNNFYKVFVNQVNGFAVNRNTIYDMTLDISSLGGDTEASAMLLTGTLDVLPWDENTIISDISQTYLTIKETRTQMRVKSDFYYATNASIEDCSLETGAPWLVASFNPTNNNMIKLVATGTDYTAPRATSLKIKVNNLTKLITVNQDIAPVADGSISLNPRAIYLSEITPAKEATLSLTPSASPWLQMAGNASVASANLANGTGNATLKYTRGTSYENTYYKYANLNTLEYDSIQVCNLFLSVSGEEVGVPGDGGTFTETDITALGGDAQWVVKSKPSWITSASNVGGDLKYVAVAEPNELDREGVITIAHSNDENYTKDIKLNQSAKYIRFPDYDYLVVRFLFLIGKDLDTSTEITNTGLTDLDKKPVGWSMGSSQGIPRKYKGYDFIEWAGDNQREGYEAVFVNMYNLCNPAYPIYGELPRYFNVDLYAAWYTNGVAPKPMDMEITLYKGGTMERVNNFDYSNKGGKQVHKQTYKDINITAETPRNSSDREKFLNNYRTKYTNIGTIRYDKFKNTATMILGGGSRTNSQNSPQQRTSSVTGTMETIPNETKEAYEKRFNLYRK